MARLPRLVLPGYPMYASVRGHQGQAIFLDDADRRTYLEWLRDAAREHELAIHAYVLTDNQAQILATPKHGQSLAKVMQSLGRRYAHYSHQRYQTTGTLWEGRFRSCLIEAEPYFIQAQQFIEQTPVVQHLVQNRETGLGQQPITIWAKKRSPGSVTILSIGPWVTPPLNAKEPGVLYWRTIYPQVT